MKNHEQAVGIAVGKCDADTKEICRSLAKEGITALVRQKERQAPEADDVSRHWSGEPGKDLFFNGWKLLF